MRALSLWQPWAAAMHLGVKHNETRSWYTAYRGDLLICSAKRKMTKDDVETYQILVEPEDGDGPYVIRYGYGLCVVELFDCVKTETILHTPEAALGNYGPGRFAWRTLNLRPLKEPVPILGRQGLWILSPEEEKAVRTQL